MMKLENLNVHEQQIRGRRRRKIGFALSALVVSLFWIWLTCYAPIRAALVLHGVFTFLTCTVALLALFKPWR